MTETESGPSRTFFGVKPKVVIKGLGMIALFGALGYLLRHFEIDQMLDKAWIDAQVQGQGAFGVALFVVIGALFTTPGLPRQIVAVMGGYAFGFVFGLIWATLAQTLGCILSFYIARLLGRDAVRAKFGERVQRIDDFLHDNTFTMTLLVRLLPVGSNIATNLAAGVSGLRALPFFLGSAIGYVPQTIIFALVGDGMNDAKDQLFLVSAVLFVASTVLGLWLYKRYRHGKRLGLGLTEEPER